MAHEPAELTAAIDAVAWVEFHHAYGPATDVPGQLRGILSGDPEVRRQAFWALYGNVYHQGSRWETSAIASYPATPDRPAVIDLLRAVGIGDFDDHARPSEPTVPHSAHWPITLTRFANGCPPLRSNANSSRAS